MNLISEIYDFIICTYQSDSWLLCSPVSQWVELSVALLFDHIFRLCH